MKKESVDDFYTRIQKARARTKSAVKPTPKLVYYAHPITLYGSIIEAQDLLLLRALGFEVLNPNCPECDDGYKKYGMEYFTRLIHNCHVLAFRAFFNGRIPAGIFQEIAWAETEGKPVIELPGGIDRRALTRGSNSANPFGKWTTMSEELRKAVAEIRRSHRAQYVRNIQTLEKTLHCPKCAHRLNTPYAWCPECGPKKDEPYGPGVVKLLRVSNDIAEQYLEDLAVTIQRWMQTYGPTHTNLRIEYEPDLYEEDAPILILTGKPRQL